MSVFSCIARQKRTHDVSLHEHVRVAPAVPPFLQRLLSVRIRLRIVLRLLQFIGVEFYYFRAGACSLAFKVFHKLPHARACRRFAEIALIGPVAILFDFDRSSYLQEPIDKFSVIALARCRQTPMVFGK